MTLESSAPPWFQEKNNVKKKESGSNFRILVLCPAGPEGAISFFRVRAGPEGRAGPRFRAPYGPPGF